MARGSAAVTVVVGAVALVVGLVAGGLGPRSEVRALRVELDEKEDCRTDLGPLGRFLDGGAFEPPPAVDTPEPDVVILDGGDATGPDVVVVEGTDAGLDSRPSPEDLTAVEDALSLRFRQARQALEEQVDRDQLAVIDDAVASMNDDLALLGEDVVAVLQEEGQPSRRDLMVYAAETLDVMIRTEDAIYEALTPEQRASLDETALDPFSYIDPGLVSLFDEIPD